jgi:hypothetical protein
MAFVRVKDKDTRHEFDVPETDWRIEAGIFERVKNDRYPAVEYPLRPKYYVKPAAARKDKKEETVNGDS